MSGFSISELAAIERHMAAMIVAAENALAKYRLVPKSERNVTITEAIKYWRNVRSGYRYALEIARQKSNVRRNGA